MGWIKKLREDNGALKIVTLAVIAFVALFISDYTNIPNMLYFKFSEIYIYIFLFTICMVILLSKGKIYLDSISFLLAIRAIIYLIPLMYINVYEGYLGNYFAVISSLLAYLISSQRNKISIQKPVNIIFSILLVVASLQVLYLALILGANGGLMNVSIWKYHIHTPMGKSNYIACIILPLIIFTFYSETKRVIKYIIVAIGLAALLIIRSKNAISVLIIFVAIKVIFPYIKHIRKQLKSNDDVKPVIIGIIILIVVIALGIFFMIRYLLIKWNLEMSYDTSSFYEFINAMTSNRLNIYSSELSRWTNHMFFGNGLGYGSGDYKSHNWIIDLLSQSGLIGLLTFVSALVIWNNKTNMYKRTNYFVKSCYYACIIILFQGLFEVSLFTVEIDIVFWYIIGLSISEVNNIRHQVTREG